jgi:hypothetical protein
MPEEPIRTLDKVDPAAGLSVSLEDWLPKLGFTIMMLECATREIVVMVLLIAEYSRPVGQSLVVIHKALIIACITTFGDQLGPSGRFCGVMSPLEDGEPSPGGVSTWKARCTGCILTTTREVAIDSQHFC